VHKLKCEALAAVLLSGCHSSSPPPPPTPRGRDSVTYSIGVPISETLGNPVAAAGVREAINRSNRAATQVDTIIVRPDTLKLRAGQSLNVWTTLSIDARDDRGDPVAHFAPQIDTGDHAIAEFTGFDLVAHRSGATWVVLRAFSSDSALVAKPAHTTVWLIVEP